MHLAQVLLKNMKNQYFPISFHIKDLREKAPKSESPKMVFFVNLKQIFQSLSIYFHHYCTVTTALVFSLSISIHIAYTQW